jgi:hypothetical protein
MFQILETRQHLMGVRGSYVFICIGAKPLEFLLASHITKSAGLLYIGTYKNN